MKTTKIFMMAALAVTFAACSNNDDNDFAQQPAEQPANDEITITATVDADATTRALSINGSNIASTWEATDQFAILYYHGGTYNKSIATVSSISGTTATITFSIPATVTSNTACTIVYPAAAATADNTGPDIEGFLSTQDGTIENCPEVRTDDATINTSTRTLTGVDVLAAQNAIFKFTVQDLSATDKSATEFKVSDSSGNVITTVTSGSAMGTLYVALPVMAAGTYWFNATIGGKAYVAKATTTAATTAGTYYQTTVKMATIGDLICSDSKFYSPTADLPSGVTKAAMIAYLGNSSGCNHGMALAMEDESSSKMNWSDAMTAAAAHTPTITIGTWLLPNNSQWASMINACKNVLGTYNSFKDLRFAFSSRGGTNLNSNFYWTSSENGSSEAYRYYFYDGSRSTGGKTTGTCYVRSALSF